jgi:hypothetical protein
MSTLDPLPNCWRLSRYEPALRARDSRWESWTSYSDVGKEFNGITLTFEEYLRVENLYIDAVTRFAMDAAADVFRVVYIGHQQTGFGLSAGQRLLLSDLAPVVRGNLRETLDCALEGVEGTSKSSSDSTSTSTLPPLRHVSGRSSRPSELVCMLRLACP